MDRLIKKAELLELVGASYPTIWRWMRDGAFPRSVILGERHFLYWLIPVVSECHHSRLIYRRKRTSNHRGPLFGRLRLVLGVGSILQGFGPARRNHHAERIEHRGHVIVVTVDGDQFD